MQPLIVEEIKPRAVKEKLERKEEFFLLDVREEDEVASPESRDKIPLHLAPSRLSKLPREKEVVVHCHHGQRSMLVAQYLKRRGFRDVKNLREGIDARSLEVDPLSRGTSDKLRLDFTQRVLC